MELCRTGSDDVHVGQSDVAELICAGSALVFQQVPHVLRDDEFELAVIGALKGSTKCFA